MAPAQHEQTYIPLPGANITDTDGTTTITGTVSQTESVGEQTTVDQSEPATAGVRQNTLHKTPGLDITDLSYRRAKRSALR